MCVVYSYVSLSYGSRHYFVKKNKNKLNKCTRIKPAYWFLCDTCHYWQICGNSIEVRATRNLEAIWKLLLFRFEIKKKRKSDNLFILNASLTLWMCVCVYIYKKNKILSRDKIKFITHCRQRSEVTGQQNIWRELGNQNTEVEYREVKLFLWTNQMVDLAPPFVRSC